ncbi:MAG: radical SAM/SPASM domain-containing protein [Planctomycetota bacterium]|jgi:hypothetical protein
MNAEDRLSPLLAILDSRPFFDVEITARCHLRCIFCPRETLARPRGMMEPAAFRPLLAWMPSGSRIVLSGLGEPLQHPEVAGFVKTAKALGHTIGLTTNGTLLDDGTASDLVGAGLGFLEWSFPSLIPERYERIMAGADFRTVIRNLRGWARERPEGLTTFLSVTLCEENADERDALEAFAGEMRFIPFLRKMHGRGGALYVPPPVPAGGSSPWRCGLFAKVTFIAWNGDLLACCNDPSGATRLGSIGETGFEALQREKRRRIAEEEGFDGCGLCDDDFREFLQTNRARRILQRWER